MKNTKYRIGIIGAGWIADKMAETLTGLAGDYEKYAIASRAHWTRIVGL